MINKQENVEKIKIGIDKFDVENVKNAVLELIAAKVSPEEIIDAMGEGMSVVGKKYENGEYFTAELIMAGETMKEGLLMKNRPAYLRDKWES